MIQDRRKFLKNAALLIPVISIGSFSLFSFSKIVNGVSNKFKRVRPGNPLWPSNEKWEQLNKTVNGRLIKIKSPFDVCKTSMTNSDCDSLFKNLKNPFFIGDNPALTQTSGWLDAWQAKPSVYAVVAKKTADVVAAVNFARKNNLRLVVKGGGHSYQGTSNSEDSLLIWTKAMKKITIHESFVPEGCRASNAVQHAVTIESGALWIHAYDAVTTKNNRYVQGGGCTTVGVAGLIQSGGFGSLSKNYGLAASSLLEAEIVMADGLVKIVNEYKDSDLFWALKGGGGGSFGVVTKLTLKTHELPEKVGGVSCRIKATNGVAFKKLIHQILKQYKSQLFNPHWGEQISFISDNTVNVSMMFQGINQQQAMNAWQNFVSWVNKSSQNYSFEVPFSANDIPARNLWDTEFLKEHAPDAIEVDDRPGAQSGNMYWAGTKGEAGQFLYAYHSAWLPAKLLEENNDEKLTNAIYASSRHWTISLHFNKGLAGAPPKEILKAKDTAMNPAVLDAFALAIIAGEGKPSFVGITGHEPNLAASRSKASKIDRAMEELLKEVPEAGSYVAESNFFQKDWQRSFWGSNYQKLAALKKKYDPEGLFFVHHGVGSEEWSDNGFIKIK